MSIHADPRQYSADPEEREEWQRDLRSEYARETYEEKHPMNVATSASIGKKPPNITL